ncbi:Proteinaceous RNase P 3 [Vitis vinifera]|uniref:Proteinaceous RNase P 3 n=1 Tax=Vitis vinifera TaxID=29760 RepID=A0A438EEL6_VITVI|nr:Proteinaceous RNase P 3 [Vitis vinifera]
MFRFDLDTCSKRRDLFGAVALFESAVSQNFRLIHYHYNALLYLCTISVDEPSSKALALDYGFRIFDHVVNSGVTPNEATITSVASLAAAKSDGDLAFEVVRTMVNYELSSRLRTYGPALFWFCANLKGEKAWVVEEHMVSMGVHPEKPELAAVKVSAKMGRGDKVYAYLHKLRTAVRSGAVEEVALKNGGGWHGQGWIGKGRPETEMFSELVAAMAMEREFRSNFRSFR